MKILSSEKDATLPSAVVGLNAISDKLEENIAKLKSKTDKTEEDFIIMSCLAKGRDKIVKHYQKCNWVN